MMPGTTGTAVVALTTSAIRLRLSICPPRSQIAEYPSLSSSAASSRCLPSAEISTVMPIGPRPSSLIVSSSAVLVCLPMTLEPEADFKSRRPQPPHADCADRGRGDFQISGKGIRATYGYASSRMVTRRFSDHPDGGPDAHWIVGTYCL